MRGSSLQLPPVGLGLWKSKPGEVGEAIKVALACGYRLLDGAAAYSNEKEVGDALADCLRDGVVARGEVFVVSKLFNTHHVWHEDRSRPAAALAKTLADLRLPYLDLYLMHWPVAFEQTDLASIGGLRLKDGTPNPKLVMEFEYVETWREMLQMKRQGKVRHLGVCNFNVEMLKTLMEEFPDFQTPPGLYFNPYFANLNLAMAPPLGVDGQVTYDDGTEATVSQMSADVAAFLTWTAEPKLVERKQTGFAVLVFLLFATVLAYFAKRQVWSSVKPKKA